MKEMLVELHDTVDIWTVDYEEYNEFVSIKRKPRM